MFMSRFNWECSIIFKEEHPSKKYILWSDKYSTKPPHISLQKLLLNRQQLLFQGGELQRKTRAPERPKGAALIILWAKYLRGKISESLLFFFEERWIFQKLTFLVPSHHSISINKELKDRIKMVNKFIVQIKFLNVNRQRNFLENVGVTVIIKHCKACGSHGVAMGMLMGYLISQLHKNVK